MNLSRRQILSSAVSLVGAGVAVEASPIPSDKPMSRVDQLMLEDSARMLAEWDAQTDLRLARTRAELEQGLVESWSAPFPNGMGYTFQPCLHEEIVVPSSKS